jgi:3-oxoacyl-[acyl-carrier-protein] synthase II
MELLRLGSADLVLAGGADFLSDSVFAGFHALGVLSAAKCSPFGLPMGTTLGEGAGFLLLECEEYARARGKEPLAYLAGYGLSSDAFHETSPDPKGRGVGRAMASALAAADLGQERVGYVNAHGSGTEANDRSEWLAIQNLFGEKAKRLPVSSTKGHLGHAQGAAGVLEGIVTLLSLREGVVPPTLRCNTRRSFGPDDPVDAPRPRAARYEQSLCVSSAFGGANCVVAFSRPGIHGEPVSNGMHGIDEGREAPRAEDRDAGFVPGIAVRLGAVGLGSVGPFSSFQDSVDRWLGGEEIPPRPLSDLSIQDLAPMADPRDMDNLSRYLVAASTLALKDAGVRVRGSLRDRIGLVVGTDSVSAEEARRFYDSIDKRGLVRCNATSFARMVLNGAAGTCSRILSLRGPTSTVTTGQSSGLLAIVYACQILASQADVDFMIAAGVDAQGLDEELEDGRADGAACLVLGKGGAGEQAHGLGSGVGRADEAPVLVGGWGIAGPGDSARAVAAALEPSGAKLDDVDLVVGDPLPRTLHPAFGSSWVAAAAVRALRTGRARTALVCSDGGRSASCALFLTQAEVDHE